MLPLLLSFPHGSNGRSKCTSHHFGMCIKKGMIGFEWESMDEGGFPFFNETRTPLKILKRHLLG